ncbi:MAG: DUF790 family protein, partial [Acidobacteriota bacterium]
MLTTDLVRVRTVKGEIRPRFVDPTDDDVRALAAQLIATFDAQRGAARHALDADLRDQLGTGTAFLLHRGLAKLLRDRCTFEVDAPAAPSQLRAAVFAAAARAYTAAQLVAAAGDEDDRATTDDGGEMPAPFDRAAVLADASAQLAAGAVDDPESSEVPSSVAIAPAALDRALFGDLKDEQLLADFETCTVDWLLDRYNIALAQAVLLRAESLTIECRGLDVPTQRSLYRKIKFFQLMHRIEPFAAGDDGAAGWRIHLDGPLSVFGPSGRYGVHMGRFLPTLLHLDHWTLEARLRWGKRRLRRTFQLGSDSGLRPRIGRLDGRWRPEEIAWLPDRVAKLDRGWRLEDTAEVVDLDGQGVLVP